MCRTFGTEEGIWNTGLRIRYMVFETGRRSREKFLDLQFSSESWSQASRKEDILPTQYSILNVILDILTIYGMTGIRAGNTCSVNSDCLSGFRSD